MHITMSGERICLHGKAGCDPLSATASKSLAEKLETKAQMCLSLRLSLLRSSSVYLRVLRRKTMAANNVRSTSAESGWRPPPFGQSPDVGQSRHCLRLPTPTPKHQNCRFKTPFRSRELLTLRGHIIKGAERWESARRAGGSRRDGNVGGDHYFTLPYPFYPSYLSYPFSSGPNDLQCPRVAASP